MIKEAKRAKKEATANEKKVQDQMKPKPLAQKQQLSEEPQKKQPPTQLQRQQPTQSENQAKSEEAKQASPTRTEQIKIVETIPKTNLKSAIKKSEASLSVSLSNLSANNSKLFHHFEQYKRDYSIVEKLGLDNPSVHPAFIKLGLDYAHDRISGSNSRCMAFLQALKLFINDYKQKKKEKSISDDLESKLKPNIK